MGLRRGSDSPLHVNSWLLCSKSAQIQDAVSTLLPSFSSHNEVKQHFAQYPALWEKFSKFPAELQEELLGFCVGEHGLKVTYDPVFQRVFHPDKHPDRMESFLSSFLGRKVRIIDILPRKGTQMVEKGNFVIMDALVQLDDGSYANVEMQKIGYQFPLARTDCYVSDIIMRQYEWRRAQLGKKFDFRKLQKVYCIILMEESPGEFHTAERNYIHKRSSYFDTGIFRDDSGLHEEYFICLDIFHSTAHNITKYSTVLDGWLAFFSTTELSEIKELVRNFPAFLSIYQEIADFVKEPEELMHMFSEALYIMDHNTERLMVSELRDEVNAVKIERDTMRLERDSMQTERDTMQSERDIFKLRLKGKTLEEISTELSIDIEKISKILGESNQGSQNI